MARAASGDKRSCQSRGRSKYACAEGRRFPCTGIDVLFLIQYFFSSHFKDIKLVDELFSASPSPFLLISYTTFIVFLSFSLTRHGPQKGSMRKILQK